MGAIGRFHAKSLLERQVPRGELTAICGPRLETLQPYGPLPLFTDGMDLIRSGLVDAVLIATPHPLHAPFALAAMERGIHVLLEKPIASHKAEADRLLTASRAAQRKHPGLRVGGILQMRTEPRYLKLRELLRDGQGLGNLVRVNWITTDWFRTEAYYSGSSWRATWEGEGGGLLINQCLHNLDMLQWICGMPARVRGFCQLGRFHRIEAEDSVSAYLEWADGATGLFAGSSGEAPGTNRLEIAGTRGSVVLEHDRIRLTRLATDAPEFSRSATQGFAAPESTVTELPAGTVHLPHALIIRNFVESILEGRPLIAPIEECTHSVELANSILHSSLLGETLSLPMDGAAWEEMLQGLAARSQFRKGPAIPEPRPKVHGAA